jgi:Icc-related predicted phosphoesterase
MFGKKDSKKFIKIFFATDIHGSDICFRKFLNAASYYKVDALVLGGDLTGKMIVPIVERPDGKFETSFLGNVTTVDNAEGAKQLEEKIRNTGFYPYITNSNEMKELQSDKKKIDELFQNVMLETLGKWVKFAEEILKPQGKKIYITGGNDDPFSIEPILNKSNYAVNPEGKIVDIGEFQMISSGYSNMTPWKCPRDIEDTVLGEKI